MAMDHCHTPRRGSGSPYQTTKRRRLVVLTVRKAFDLARFKTREIALQFRFDDGHEEVESDDVDQGHREDRGIREVDDRAELHGRANDDKEAKEN